MFMGSACSSDHHPSSREARSDLLQVPYVFHPGLLQFTNTLEHFKFDSATFEFFKERVHMMFYPHGDPKSHAP